MTTRMLWRCGLPLSGPGSDGIGLVFGGGFGKGREGLEAGVDFNQAGIGVKVAFKGGVAESS